MVLSPPSSETDVVLDNIQHCWNNVHVRWPQVTPSLDSDVESSFHLDHLKWLSGSHQHADNPHKQGTGERVNQNQPAHKQWTALSQTLIKTVIYVQILLSWKICFVLHQLKLNPHQSLWEKEHITTWSLNMLLCSCPIILS